MVAFIIAEHRPVFGRIREYLQEVKTSEKVLVNRLVSTPVLFIKCGNSMGPRSPSYTTVPQAEFIVFPFLLSHAGVLSCGAARFARAVVCLSLTRICTSHTEGFYVGGAIKRSYRYVLIWMFTSVILTDVSLRHSTDAPADLLCRY
jgi:hypothetical protein